MTLQPVDPGIAANHNLLQRWPDFTLYRCFRELMSVFQDLSQPHPQDADDSRAGIRRGYETICHWIQDSFSQSSDSRDLPKDRHQESRAIVRSLVVEMQVHYGDEWLQSLASLLGMLMHFSSSSNGSNPLVNHRRPQKVFSTYPNSPAVAKFVGDAVISRLLRHPVPTICHRQSDAERYAERALAFRVLDPSMESGQLLLEVACGSIRQVLASHLPSSKTARYLNRALLEKLCCDCLWGIDRNELAVRAVELSFYLLGMEFGIKKLAPQNLITGDSLEYFNEGRDAKFDGIINNPPWGEILRPAERKRLRTRFSTLEHRSDTYVAFSEMAIRNVRPDGAFVLILPSQVVAARNTARLRDLFLNETDLEQMILLPRSAFANATVRGLVILGRTQPRVPSAGCRITTYPVVKRLAGIGPPRSFTVQRNALQSGGEGSWWPLLSGHDLSLPRSRTVPLEQIADVICGVHLYKKGKGVPPQTAGTVRNRPFTLSEPGSGAAPAIRGRDVREFCLSDPHQFITFGRWLAWIGNHDSLRRLPRIFVRELCRRDGKLSAAVATDGLVPLHGVLTVVPKMIDVYALAGILNSTMAAAYVSRHAASFSKVDFQRITVRELRKMPIPIAAIHPDYRATLGQPTSRERELLLLGRLAALARKLSNAVKTKDSKTERLFAEMNAIVSAMSDLAEDENE